MNLKIDKEERKILKILDAIVRQESVSAIIDSIVLQVERKLSQDFGALLVWEPVPLATYGDRLPNMIHSSWVFVLPAQTNTGAEKHPNSHQRMMSYRGSGDLQIWNGERWCSNHRISDSEARIESRWVSIPPNIWHQAVVPEENWVVVSFHTVFENELIEERPNPTDNKLTRQRRYLDEQRMNLIQNTKLREFRQEDVEALKRLIYKTIDISYHKVYPEEAIEYFKDYHTEEHILGDAIEGYTIILECDGKIVGTGTLLGTNIRRVFIDPSHQHKGLGKLVMHELEKRALEKGISILDLSASLVSKQFYDSSGYVTQKEDYIPVRNKQKLSYYAMVKTLYH
jgi:GNAT superfamily N-acetyltransferase